MTTLRSSSAHRAVASLSERHAQPKKPGAEPPSRATHRFGAPKISAHCRKGAHGNCYVLACVCPCGHGVSEGK